MAGGLWLVVDLALVVVVGAMTVSYPWVDENGMCVCIGLVRQLCLFSLLSMVRFALPGRLLPDRLHSVRAVVSLM